MNNQNTKLENIFKWGVYIPIFLTLVTPILFYSAFLFPFITTKTLYFRILVEIALASYFGLMLISKKYWPRFNMLGWAIAAYFAIITIASFFGINLYRSFWGNIERGEGLLTMYHLFAWWIMLISVFRTKKMWLLLLGSAFTVAIVETFYGLYQIMDVPWVIDAGASRISGTIGNPAFMGAYLLLGMIVGGSIYPFVKQWWLKILIGAGLVFQLFMIYKTETRGVILAMILVYELIGAGYFIYITRLLIVKTKVQKKEKEEQVQKGLLTKLAVALVAISFIPVILFAAWNNPDSNWVQKSGTLRRIVSISVDDITTQSRFYAWDSSWSAWKNKFILGYGYENYNVAFNKYFHPEIFLDQGSQLWFDRAHNILFDQAVNSGILGLAAYLAVFAVSFFLLFKNIRSEKSRNMRAVALIISAGLLVYFGQNLVVFDTISSYGLFYLILAFVHFLTSTYDESRQEIQPSSLFTGGKWALYTAFLIILAVGAYAFNIKPAKANMLAIEALQISRRVDFIQPGEDPMLVARKLYPEVFDTFKKAISLQTYQSQEIIQKMTEIALIAGKNQYLTNVQKENIYNYIIKELKQNIRHAPYEAQNYMYLMSVYNASSRFDGNRLNLVLSTGEKAIELSPNRPQIYFEMGQAAIKKGDNEQGIGYFKKALELNPIPYESQWNLAAAYIVTGKFEEADKTLKKLIQNGYAFYKAKNLSRLSRVYVSVRAYDRMIPYYNDAIEKNTAESEQLIKQLAEIYAKYAAWLRSQGDEEGAREAVTKAVKLDPNLKSEAELFLKQTAEDN